MMIKDPSSGNSTLEINNAPFKQADSLRLHFKLSAKVYLNLPLLK